MSGEVAELERPVDAVPVGWQQTTLGCALAKSEGGGTPPRDVEEYWNGDIPWASVKDVVKGEGSTPEETITPAGLANSTSKLIAAGTNIFAARMGVGAVVRYPFPVAINQDLMALTPSSELDPGYLFYWLQARKEAFVAVATGTTVKGIRKDVLLSFPMVLPPLDEQRRIAEVLRSVDEAIAATLATNKQAQIALHSARANLLTPLAETTDLGDVCDVVGGYAFKSTSFVESGVKVLRISNITESGVDFSGRVVCVAEQDLRGLDRFRLRPLDTVVALSGATTGKMCVFAFGEPVYANQRVAFIRVKEGLADQGYINHVLSMLTASVRQSAYGGAQPNISTKEIAAMEIALPRLTEQHEIAEVLDGLSQAVALGDQVLIAQQATKATLMSDLLSGRVRVPA